MSVHSLARTLGVSAATVSLALRDNPRISPQTRERVRAAAAEAGFTPNLRLSALMSEMRNSALHTYRGTLAVVAFYHDATPWRRLSHLQLMVEAARRRAAQLGYKVETFSLGEAGMTASRLRGILAARGIGGVFCLGTERPGEPLPEVFADLPLVVQGASVPGPLNRVMSNFAADGCAVLEELAARGYARPGLAIECEGDRRTDFGYSNTYLGMSGRLFPAAPLPVLRTDRFSKDEFTHWFWRHRPDAIILHHKTAFLAELRTLLRDQQIAVGHDLGLALLDHIVEPAVYSGIRQDPELVAEIAIDNLIAEVAFKDFRRGRREKLELVRGTWNEGATLRPRLTPAGGARGIPLMV